MRIDYRETAAAGMSPQTASVEAAAREAGRVCFVTLGCKVNSAETEGMKSLLSQQGWRIVAPEEPADVCVINTCTVTQAGARKSRQMVRRLRAHNPSAIVVVTGCYAQVSTEEVSALEGVDIVLGNDRKHEIPALLASFREARDRLGGPLVAVTGRELLREFEALPVSDWTGQTRAFVKVQDGCDRFCSYCIIPYARGPVRSRTVADTLAEVEQLAGKGFTEFVLTGIHLAAYRDRAANLGLRELLAALDDMPGVRRVRLGSLEPFTLTEAFLDVLRQSKKLCPHFHISLQSGSDAVLQRMNRRYAAARFAKMLRDIRERFADVSITTDVMVGFPGETEAEFEASLAFCEQAAFSWLHVFPYSPRPGTPAATFPDQIPNRVKEARAARMGDLSQRLKAEHLAARVGKWEQVLLERPDPEKPAWHEGFTASYLPVLVPGDGLAAGQYVTVHICQATADLLIAESPADTRVSVSPPARTGC